MAHAPATHGDVHAHLDAPGRRGGPAGAYLLGTPGTYTEEAQGCLVVGNRATRSERWAVRALLGLTLLVAWLLWPHAPVVGAATVILVGLPAQLLLLDAQRYEVRRDRVTACGRWHGRAWSVAWTLPTGSVVEVLGYRESRDDPPTGPVLVRVWTSSGWLPLAASDDEQAMEALAGAVARVTRLPLVRGPTAPHAVAAPPRRVLLPTRSPQPL